MLRLFCSQNSISISTEIWFAMKITISSTTTEITRTTTKATTTRLCSIESQPKMVVIVVGVFFHVVVVDPAKISLKFD